MSHINLGCPASTDEARDIAKAFQAMGFTLACHKILKMIEEGEIDVGPKATGRIAGILATSEKLASEHREPALEFVRYWDEKEGESIEILHSLEDLLRDLE